MEENLKSHGNKLGRMDKELTSVEAALNEGRQNKQHLDGQLQDLRDNVRSERNRIGELRESVKSVD